MGIIKSKSMKVSELPNGYFKNQLTLIAINEDVKVNVVAVEGYAKDWSAYIGWPKFEDTKTGIPEFARKYYSENVQTPEQVAEIGDKLPEDMAREIFPDIEETYRD